MIRWGRIFRPQRISGRGGDMARISLKEILEQKPDIDQAKIDATTEEDIRRHAIEDGEDPDAEIPDSSWRLVQPPKL
jgi:putative transcriptional regulator